MFHNAQQPDRVTWSKATGSGGCGWKILTRFHLCCTVLYTQWTIKKCDILFLTITLANLNGFLQFLYHFNREEILHATVVKFTTSP